MNRPLRFLVVGTVLFAVTLSALIMGVAGEHAESGYSATSALNKTVH